MSEEIKQVSSIHLDEMRDSYPWRYGVLIVDVETTGLYSHGCYNEYFDDYGEPDEILQISIINGSGYNVFNSYVWPSHHKSWNPAQKINGISYSEVRDAPSIMELRPKLQEIFDGCRVYIGYNTSFDMSFLVEAGINFDRVKYFIDVMEDFAAHYGEMPDWVARDPYPNWTWQKLTKAARLTGFMKDYWDPNSPELYAHNSIYDCRATLHVSEWLKAHPENLRRNLLYYD